MKKDINGFIREMTEEEIAQVAETEFTESKKEIDANYSAMQAFAEELSSSETTSISKIREAAKRFLEFSSNH